MLGDALRVVGVGVLVGLIAALFASRLLTRLLFEVGPFDPIALSGACVILLCVGASAAWLPSRRAVRVDPALALRSE